MRYDPDAGPDPDEWLAADEAEREIAVRRHHKHAHQQVGESARTHAAIHVIVENQLAEGHAEAIATLERLTAEGLDRHEAVHAIGSVVAREMWEMVQNQTVHDAARYARRLKRLTAARWREGGAD
jgi:hypothetical protein